MFWKLFSPRRCCVTGLCLYGLSKLINYNCHGYYQGLLLPENDSKNPVFNWVSKLHLDHQTFLNTTKVLPKSNLQYVIFFSNLIQFSLICQNITTCSRLLGNWNHHLEQAFFPLYLRFSIWGGECIILSSTLRFLFRFQVFQASENFQCHSKSIHNAK